MSSVASTSFPAHVGLKMRIAALSSPAHSPQARIDGLIELHRELALRRRSVREAGLPDDPLLAAELERVDRLLTDLGVDTAWIGA